MSKTRQPKRRWRSGRGALWLIALLLLGSGGTRFADGAGPALARGVEEMMGESHSAAEDTELAECEAPDSISAVLAELKNRQMELDQREADLADRIAALALAEEEINRNLSALQQAEEELSQTLALADEAAEGDLARLTSVYENMKPKEASALFETMDPDFAAGFLGRMRPDAAAAIMAGLSAQSAYTISVVLAGRNANVPTE
jgi:flagellar motility protein MotE (MotC chaperone)